jgi:4-amino-4-deoxy-L-arabinose transferase-like glycosyltransferase
MPAMTTSVQTLDSGNRQTGLRAFSGVAWDMSILLAVFSAVLLPFAMTWVLVYPDEPQYLDAGVLMRQNHDYLMPACANDAPPEDLKPIFTYWVILLSYQVLGASVAAARIPFLLAAIAVVWLTYRLVLMVTKSAESPSGSRLAARVACVLLLCNPIFWLAAVRCIPDIWLTLFLLISSYGFLGLLTLNQPRRRHAYAAYVGVGLATLSKGVPALVFLGFVALFCSCGPWRREALRRVVHIPSMLVATIVTVSWFVAAWLAHDEKYLWLLWSDQIGTRVASSPWLIVFRFLFFFGALTLVHLGMLWPMWKMGQRWRSLLPCTDREQVAAPFMLLWTVINVLAMAGTADWYVRYLLPSFPLLAALVGATLVKVDEEILRRCWRLLLKGTIVLTLLFATLLAPVGWQLEWTLPELLLTFAMAVLMTVAAVVGLRGTWLHSAQAMAIIGLLWMPVVFLMLQRIVRPDLDEQIISVLRCNHLDSETLAGVVGQKALASRLRLALSQTKLLQWETWPESGAADFEKIPVLILPQASAAGLPQGRYTLIPAGRVFASPPDREWWAAIGRGKLKELMLQSRIPYSIAVRRTPGTIAAAKCEK